MASTVPQSPPVSGEALARRDLRQWIALAEAAGQVRRVNGADWDLEIGGLTEMVCHQSRQPRCLLFDEIKGYPPGWRVLSNTSVTPALGALTLGLPPTSSAAELVQAWRAKARQMRLLPTEEVADGPVYENVLRGADVDLHRFPTPRWHEEDGGRYIGTGDIVVTRDPEDGQVNVGTYRMMVQDRDKLGLYISPGHHGRLHRDKYFARGEPMPVVAAFGADPLLFTAGAMRLPITMNEYEWVGAVRGAPVEIVRGPVTGLPLPAQAEIVVEGFVYPERTLAEGPFGEFTGYYASAVRQEPYVQVEALYHRHEPIILGSPPMRPPSDSHYVRTTVLQGLIWDALEAAGVPDVRGIAHTPAAGWGLLVISIKQRYGGHARQAAMVAAQSSGGAYLGRYVVVVDEDIDPSNLDEVLWALWTRSDPEQSLDLLRNCWSTPLDPRIPPEKRALRDYTNSRLIIDATRPFHWRDQFPPPVGTSAALQARLREKWGGDLLA
jgi:UbiD family decarboxylase